MNLFLDDIRDIPNDYIGCRNAKEAIRLLKTGKVSLISFDHDLGSCVTGYDVAVFIENNVEMNLIPMPNWKVHSSNPVGAKRINQAMESASHIDWLRQDGEYE